MEYLELLGGLILLLASGEALVKGAVGIARRFNLSPLVIGMTIVAFGTSAPELLVCLQAALSGHPDLAVGNVIASNIANLGLVLGLTALIFPIPVNRNSLRIDWPMMMITLVVFYIFAWDGTLDMIEGVIFVVWLLVFMFWLIRKSGKTEAALAEEEIKNERMGSVYRNLLFLGLSCFGLIVGADYFLSGATQIAINFQVPDRIIAVTIVALGTSLPEVITSVVAAYRKHTDIAIGNLVGSCIYNLLGILGVTAIVKSIAINPTMMNIDYWWMIGVSVAMFPIMIIFKKFNRLSGIFFLSIYVVYILFVLIK